jgi:hypothetical protein
MPSAYVVFPELRRKNIYRRHFPMKYFMQRVSDYFIHRSGINVRQVNSLSAPRKRHINTHRYEYGKDIIKSTPTRCLMQSYSMFRRIQRMYTGQVA